MDVVAFLQGLLSRDAEWGQAAVIVSLDVATAFDCLRPNHVANELRSRRHRWPASGGA